MESYLKQRINEVESLNQNWHKKHLNAIKTNYAKSKNFQKTYPLIKELYEKSSSLNKLIDINRLFIKEISDFLPNSEDNIPYIVRMHPAFSFLNNHLLPDTAEKLYYRFLFEKYYSGLGKIIPYFWMPKYVETNDASARTLKIYK